MSTVALIKAEQWTHRTTEGTVAAELGRNQAVKQTPEGLLMQTGTGYLTTDRRCVHGPLGKQKGTVE